MAGLVNQQMNDPQAPAQGAAPAVQDIGQTMGLNDAAAGADESDPNYQQALKFALSALYQGKPPAAEHIAQQLQSASNVPETLANAAYEIVTITDEKTEGAIPDELLILFASNILQEVCDIATTAGIKIKASDVATALKTMILRYLGENGVDTTQLSAAMDKVPPEQFDKHAESEGLDDPAQDQVSNDDALQGQ